MIARFSGRIAVLGGLLLCGCKGGSQPGTVPVAEFLTVGQSCSRSPLRTEIYNYVGRNDLELQKYETDQKAPLRFSFPMIYYHYKQNLAGGPQVVVGISLYYETLEPFNQGFCKGRQANERDRITVEILSNLSVSPLGPNARSVKPHILQAYSRGGLENEGFILGLHAYSYRSATEKPIEGQDKRSGGARRLYRSHLMLTPIFPSKSDIKFVDCRTNNPNCTVYMAYKGKPVRMVFPKQHFNGLAKSARAVLRLVANADVDR